jgi:hypothetical protein
MSKAWDTSPFWLKLGYTIYLIMLPTVIFLMMLSAPVGVLLDLLHKKRPTNACLDRME